jgi:hypothetical protein
MADPKQIEILNKGVEAWNQWRSENPAFLHDLSRANLSGANLKEANLNQADLRQAFLNGVDLRFANLIGANLGSADLSSSNLGAAGLRQANLSAALLIMADLRGANLIGADLRAAELHGADFSKVAIGYTNFADVDLREVRGLETVEHSAPSEISISTIYRSHGKIPEIFLRGAGVPDNFIAYMHSLTGNAFEFYSCFISYSSKDQGFAERLHADLQAKGVRCWFATEDLKIGDPFRQRIDDAIRRYDKLLVVLSETSVASTWVESEVETALEREQGAEGKTVLFPIRLDEAVMKTSQAWAADIRRKRHMGDFSRWQDHASYQKAFQRLLRDLQGAEMEEV